MPNHWATRTIADTIYSLDFCSDLTWNHSLLGYWAQCVYFKVNWQSTTDKSPWNCPGVPQTTAKWCQVHENLKWLLSPGPHWGRHQVHGFQHVSYLRALGSSSVWKFLANMGFFLFAGSFTSFYVRIALTSQILQGCNTNFKNDVRGQTLLTNHFLLKINFPFPPNICFVTVENNLPQRSGGKTRR